MIKTESYSKPAPIDYAIGTEDLLKPTNMTTIQYEVDTEDYMWTRNQGIMRDIIAGFLTDQGSDINSGDCYASISNLLARFNVPGYDPCRMVDAKYREEVRQKLGRYPKAFYGFYQKMFHAAWGAPIQKYTNDFAFIYNFKQRKPMILIDALRKLWGLKPELDELTNDNHYHTAPTLFCCMRYLKPDISEVGSDLNIIEKPHTSTIKKLRDYYGPAKWRKICKNSLHRNKLLGRYSFESKFMHVPSTVLKQRMCNQVMSVRSVEITLNILKESHITLNHFLRVEEWLNDTARMMGRPVEQLKYIKTWQRLEEIHNREVEKQNEKNNAPLSDEPITKGVPVALEGYEFTPLISARQIADHGSEMHHCVKIYMGSVVEGVYYVYKILNISTGEINTLGLRRNQYDRSTFTGAKIEVGEWYVDQCHRKYNQANDIPDEVRRHILTTFTNNLQKSNTSLQLNMP